MTGVLVAVGTLLLAALAGLALKARDGRIRAAAPSRPSLPDEVRAALDPSASVTLVQLSTTFCAPCRQTRALLGHVAERTDGLAHAEIDLTDRPSLATALSVLRTPTTLAVAADGTELLRVGGVPDRAKLLDALQPHLP